MVVSSTEKVNALISVKVNILTFRKSSSLPIIIIPHFENMSSEKDVFDNKNKCDIMGT